MNKFSFGWKPHYEIDVTAKITNKKIFSQYVRKACEKLKWDILYCDNEDYNIIEAKRKNSDKNYSEKIYITWNEGADSYHIKSVSLVSVILDWGSNRKRAEELIWVINKIQKIYTEEQILDEIEKEKYEVPNELPPPKNNYKPSVWS